GDVKDPAQDTVAHWHGDGLALVGHLEAAFEALGASHGDGSNQSVSEVLLHFERHLRRLVLNLELDGQGVVDPRQRFRKLDVHYRTAHFYDLAFVHILLSQFATTNTFRSLRLATSDFQQFLCNIALPLLVVFE